MKHSWTDIGRHKCQFCLAFCSVFVVVLSVIVVNSVCAKGPLIFLRLAEASSGAYDGVFSHVGNHMHYLDTNTNELKNYTKFRELYNDEWNISPRH